MIGTAKIVLFLNMTLFDIIKFNKELIIRLVNIGCRPDDYKYIDLYSEYLDMRHDGDKVTYIVAFLSEKYGVSERKIYELVKRFGSSCTTHAV